LIKGHIPLFLSKDRFNEGWSAIAMADKSVLLQLNIYTGLAIDRVIEPMVVVPELRTAQPYRR
jgi:hypothetical protein